MARSYHPNSLHDWFPFTATELEVTLGLFAFIESAMALSGLVSPKVMLGFAAAYMVIAYLAGLIVHHRRSPFRFHADGALGGRGYIPYFRSSTKSLLLLHTDDDAPCEELLGLYRSLLERGVEIRRVIFARSLSDEAYSWASKGSEHPGMQQRVVAPERSELMRHSFVVVDERIVLMSVPGGEAIDSEAYASRFVLRHLLSFNDSQAAQAFTELHRQLWQRATPVLQA